jgi:hypothetical protein
VSESIFCVGPEVVLLCRSAQTPVVCKIPVATRTTTAATTGSPMADILYHNVTLPVIRWQYYHPSRNKDHPKESLQE